MNTVRLGIIGMGNIGRHHAAYLLEGKVQRCELVAVCSTSPQKLEAYKTKGLGIFDSGEKLVRSGEVAHVSGSWGSRRGPQLWRNSPPGEYGDYVRTTVDGENADRARLIEKLAKEKILSVAETERQQAELFRKNAFTGEWIEEPDAEGKFAWTQNEQKEELLDKQG